MIPAARFEWKDPRSSTHVKSDPKVASECCTSSSGLCLREAGRLGWLSRSSTKYGARLLVWTAVHCMYGVLRASARSPHSFTRQGYGLPSLQASVCSKLSFFALRLSVRRSQMPRSCPRRSVTCTRRLTKLNMYEYYL